MDPGDDGLNVPLVDFACPLGARDDEGGPAARFEFFLSEQDRAFAVSEGTVLRSDLEPGDPLIGWFNGHRGVETAFVVVFQVGAADKAYFDELLERWLAQQADEEE